MLDHRHLHDDKFVYKGRVEVVDLEVVVHSALKDERRFEVLSPEGSFVRRNILILVIFEN